MENNFSENLAKLRQLYNLTRKELAEKLGVSEQSVHYYETGKRETNFATLIKIADVFGVSIDDLLRGDTDKLKKDDEVQLAIALKNFIDKIPAEKHDSLATALPYVGEIIKFVMDSQELAREKNQPCEFSATLKNKIYTPTVAQNTKGDNKND